MPPTENLNTPRSTESATRNLNKIRKRFIPMSETMLYILLSLRDERHGYGIMLHVKELTANRVKLGAGTIYQSLGKLEGDGLIVPQREVERRKTYRITDVGQRILNEEANRIKEIYNQMDSLLWARPKRGGLSHCGI